MTHGKYYKLIDADSKALSFNLKELWQYRDLIALLVRRDFVSKYKQTVLGPAWAVIQPLLTTFVFTFVFGSIAGLADTGAVPTFLFYMCGTIVWQFFSGCFVNTANTFIINRPIMGKVYFPRLCVPVATAFSQMISLGIQLAMFIVALVIFLFIPSYSIQTNLFVLMFPVVILQSMFLGMGCGVIVSALTTKYRDLNMLVGFGVQLWMYATPVAYSLSVFKSTPILYKIAMINPVTSIIELSRYGFLGPDAGSINWIYYSWSWIVTIVLLIIGILMFNKVEKTFMDTV